VRRHATTLRSDQRGWWFFRQVQLLDSSGVVFKPTRNGIWWEGGVNGVQEEMQSAHFLMMSGISMRRMLRAAKLRRWVSWLN
jgi:hypothetical protein